MAVIAIVNPPPHCSAFPSSPASLQMLGCDTTDAVRATLSESQRDFQ